MNLNKIWRGETRCGEQSAKFPIQELSSAWEELSEEEAKKVVAGNLSISIGSTFDSLVGKTKDVVDAILANIFGGSGDN